MFSHVGRTRTPAHNLKIASLLSFVAGLVNVAGFFSVHILTTNVTGHFAFFTEEVFLLNFPAAVHLALYVFAFFFGALAANFMVETLSRIRDSYTYVFPVLLEALILAVVGFYGTALKAAMPELIAVTLLFAMGMQNSLVTSISRAIVRTTHLTGLFTDMGIEVSQLYFYKTTERRKKLLKSIKLRLTIIVMFFSGGICGALLYTRVGIQALYLGSILLLGGLLFDYIRIRLILKMRKR